MSSQNQPETNHVHKDYTGPAATCPHCKPPSDPNMRSAKIAGMAQKILETMEQAGFSEEFRLSVLTTAFVNFMKNGLKAETDLFEFMESQKQLLQVLDHIRNDVAKLKFESKPNESKSPIIQSPN